MNKYSLPPFDELYINSLEDYSKTEIEFNGREIKLDLNFKEKSIDRQKLDIVKKFITNLTESDSVAVTAIKENFKSGGIVKDYIEHHLNELETDDLSFVIDNSNKTLSKEEQMLSKVYLKRVGFYPANKKQFAVFDYTIGQELTDYIIVVNFKEDGKIDHLTMES
jgi:hypothetical protein